MSDWALVGGNPAPGDVGQMRLRVGHLDRATSALREASSELSRISRGTDEADWRGTSADAFREVIDLFRYDLRPIAGSFERVSKAVNGYASEVEDLQARARQALRRAEVAHSKERQAERDLDAARAALNRQRSTVRSAEWNQRTHALTSGAETFLDPSLAEAQARESQRLAEVSRRARASAVEAESTAKRFENDVANFRVDLGSAKREVQGIRHEWEDRSKSSARVVDGALSEHLKNRSNVEKFVSEVEGKIKEIADFVSDPNKILPFLRDFLGAYSELMGWVSSLAGFAAVILGASGIGLPLAAALLAVSAAAAVLSLATSAAKFGLTCYMRDKGLGGITDTDIALDAVDVAMSALGVVLLLAGGGAVTAPTKHVVKAGVKAGAEDFASRASTEVVKWGVEEGFDSGEAPRSMPCRPVRRVTAPVPVAP